MRRYMVGGPFDGERTPKDAEGVDEIQLYVHAGETEEYSLVYVYIENEETGNYHYEGEYRPEQLEEDDE